MIKATNAPVYRKHEWRDVGQPVASELNPPFLNVQQECKCCGAVRFVSRRADKEDV